MDGDAAWWDEFFARALRRMKHRAEGERRFGLDFLWTLLAAKEAGG